MEKDGVQGGSVDTCTNKVNRLCIKLIFISKIMKIFFKEFDINSNFLDF